MSDDRIETHVAVIDPDSGERRAIHFQEYWIRHQASVPADAVVAIGIGKAVPAPGVVEAIRDADVVLLPPSNPVVSIGTILGVPGIREALRATKAPVVGVAGIIGRNHVRGMAKQMLDIIGVDCSAGAVGVHYGARSREGILDGWLIDASDAAELSLLEAAGVKATAVPLWMTDHDATAAIARAALDLVDR